MRALSLSFALLNGTPEMFTDIYNINQTGAHALKADQRAYKFSVNSCLTT
jgi:hypothetical protein